MGVRDDGQACPVLPLDGIPKEANIRDRITNICMDAIYPPIIDEEVQVVDIPDRCDRAVVVVRLHESDLGHWTHNRTRLYLRGPGRNKAYEPIQAQDDTIEWFLDRRQKSVDLRKRLISDATARADRVLVLNSETHDGCKRTVSVTPKFPREPLATPHKLLEVGKRLANYASPVSGGVRLYPPRESEYWEAGQHGLVFHRRFVRKDEGTRGQAPLGDGAQGDVSPIRTVVELIDVLRLASDLYGEIGTPGAVLVHVDIGPMAGRSLTEPGERCYAWERQHCSDEQWQHEEEVLAAALPEAIEALATRAADDLFWAFGYPEGHLGQTLVRSISF